MSGKDVNDSSDDDNGELQLLDDDSGDDSD